LERDVVKAFIEVEELSWEGEEGEGRREEKERKGTGRR
jgi:hypothetical protein